MTTFTSGKIRKNASKKIKALLEMATGITFRSQSRGMDDCYRSNKPRPASVEQVLSWMADSWNYRSMSVYLTCDADGQPKSMTLGGASYWQDDFIITFDKEAVIPTETVKEEVKVEKPRMTIAQVKAFMAAGFVSPLSHGAKAIEEQPEDADKQITKIVVKWSESRFFDFEDKEISMEDYNRLAAMTVAMHRASGMGGYYKTELELTLASGEVVTFRHDICPNEPTLQGEWNAWVDYCRKQHAQNVETLERNAAEADKKAQEAAEVAKAAEDNLEALLEGLELEEAPSIEEELEELLEAACKPDEEISDQEIEEILLTLENNDNVVWH